MVTFSGEDGKTVSMDRSKCRTALCDWLCDYLLSNWKHSNTKKRGNCQSCRQLKAVEEAGFLCSHFLLIAHSRHFSNYTDSNGIMSAFAEMQHSDPTQICLGYYNKEPPKYRMFLVEEQHTQLQDIKAGEIPICFQVQVLAVTYLSCARSK